MNTETLTARQIDLLTRAAEVAPFFISNRLNRNTAAALHRRGLVDIQTAIIVDAFGIERREVVGVAATNAGCALVAGWDVVAVEEN